MKKSWFSLTLLLCGLMLAACGERMTLSGRYLRAENGTNLLIAEDGEPYTLSDQSRGQTLFQCLDSGDLIEISHGDVRETYPGGMDVYACWLLEDGAPERIPEEGLAALEELGYTFDFHSHAPAEAPLTVEDPVTGYCGNTVTQITLDGETYSFWGSDSVTLTDLLINLAYDPAAVCRCLPEFTVDTEFGSGYGVNLTGAYVRCEAGQAALTAEQTECIREILERNRG